MRRLAIFVAVLGLACSFDGHPIDGPDGDGGDGDGGDRACEAWGARILFDACSVPELDPGNSTGALVISQSWVYNTDDDSFVDDDDEESEAPPERFSFNAMFGGVEARVWLVDNLIVEAEELVTVTGSKPLVIASLGDIEISGRISTSSVFVFDEDQNVPTYLEGAGSGQPDCLDPGRVVGGLAGNQDGVDGGGGGGGGGYGEPGGQGGEGGVGGATTAAAKDGGPPIELAAPLRLRGGCRGGIGGIGAAGTPGAGGFGGGAIALTARNRAGLGSSGSICASGAAGHGQTAPNRNGGGGGGSGGLIILEAPTIDVSEGRVAANGGSGGGGANNNILEENRALAGNNGGCDATPAMGADGEGGAFGGQGGARANIAGAGNMDSDGAGGGGGSVGYILLVADETAGIVGAELNTQISPIPLLRRPDLSGF